MNRKIQALLGLSVMAALLAACAPEPAPEATPDPVVEPDPGGITTGEPGGEGVPVGPDETAYAEIYAAAIRQLYTVDHTFGDAPPNWPTIYVVSRTDDSVGGGEALTEGAELPAETQEAISAALSDLPAEIVWIASREEAPISDEDGTVGGGDAIIVTLGNVAVTDEDTVEVPASLYCGMLCATGMTYVIEQVDGTWQVTGTTGPVWIS